MPSRARWRSVEERGRTKPADAAAAGLLFDERERLGMHRATLARLIWGKPGDRRIHALLCPAAQKFVTCAFKTRKIHGIHRERDARAEAVFQLDYKGVTFESPGPGQGRRLLDRNVRLR
jgi:hypothetical protein